MTQPSPITIQAKGNRSLEALLKRVNKDTELNTYWKCANKIAMDRMRINDHGRVHVSIVANIALRLHRLLQESGHEFSVAKDNEGYTVQDSEVVLFLAAALHDVGHIVHRQSHEEFSIALAKPLLERLLDGLYTGEKKYTLIAEVLHTIIGHSKGFRPLTTEASILRIADALDMKKGRARIPFTLGSINIHAVSALAINDVVLRKGDAKKGEKPVIVEIVMDNPAGIFQVDSLLKEKMAGTGLEEAIGVKAEIRPGKAVSPLEFSF